MPRAAQILHTSDCHLDEFPDSAERRAFTAFVDASIDLDADLILIAGDLFDHRRVPDELLAWTAAELDRADRPVVMIPGNHDPFDDDSIHHRFSVGSRCQRVQLIDEPGGVTIPVPGTDIVVWGRAMVEHAPSFGPIDGHRRFDNDTWQVVAAHGLTTSSISPGRSSVILRSDIEQLDADYVALGHIHVHEIVMFEPLTVYPGSTARSHKGRPGCVLVDLDERREPMATWMPLDGKR